MKRIRASALAAAALAAVALVAAPVSLAGNPFSSTTSTANGYHTWDTDMINVENVGQDGSDVYVAVLDTGLVSNYGDYFPKGRIASSLGIGFHQSVKFSSDPSDPCRLDTEVGALQTGSFIGSTSSSHGTHTTSTIIGFNYRSNTDLAQGFSLPAIQVRGVAPLATVIPVKVLDDYQLPKMPKCTDPTVPQGQTINFGTDEMVAAGINYVADLKEHQLSASPVVISMSLGGSELTQGEQDAIDRAISDGVIVVASAGNEGAAGMGFPGAYAPVISAGSVGWTDEWLDHPGDQNTLTAPANGSRYRMFWLQNTYGNGLGSTGTLEPPLFSNSGNVPDPTVADDVYVSDFSSRQLAGQDLDVLAPGSWVRGPFGGDPGYNHLPFWSSGLGDLFGNNSGNFFYVGGTSMSAPHVSGTVALMLQKDPSLTAVQAETILEGSALSIPAGSAMVWNPFLATPAFENITWGADATGSGLLQTDAALAATP